MRCVVATLSPSSSAILQLLGTVGPKQNRGRIVKLRLAEQFRRHEPGRRPGTRAQGAATPLKRIARGAVNNVDQYHAEIARAEVTLTRELEERDRIKFLDSADKQRYSLDIGRRFILRATLA